HPRPEPGHQLRRRPGPAISRLRHPRSPVPGRLPPAAAAYPDRRLPRPGAGRLGHDLGNDPAHAIDAAAVFLDHARGTPAALAAATPHPAPVNGTPTPYRRKDTP